MKCFRCQVTMTLATSVLDMKQLGELGEHHKRIREAREVRFTTWGNSIGVRIPKELAKELKITNGTTGRIMKEKGGIKIVKT